MLAVLLRSTELFAKYKDHLQPEHFANTDRGYRLVWQTVLDYHREHGKLPDAQALMNQVTAAVGKDRELLTDIQQREVEAFIDEVFSRPNRSPLDMQGYMKWVPATIRRLREEAVVNKVAEEDNR